MPEPIPLKELYAEYNAMRDELLEVADALPDGHDFKTTIIESDKKIRELQEERDAKVKDCHPAGEHWPPDPKCPDCQRVAAMWELRAKERCKELGLAETEDNLEIALKDYLTTRRG